MLPKNRPYFIVETAFHHEGNVNFLNELLDKILLLDIDAVKFHLLFDLDDYIISEHPARPVLEKISISREEWLPILNRCAEAQKDIVLLTNDIESLKWVNSIQREFPIEAIELHSTGLNDIFLLKESLNFSKTVILGVGGSTFDEVSYAIKFLESNSKDDILLMHGFQNYPTNFEDINLSRMGFYGQAFGYPIGYADHTDPSESMNALISALPQGMGHNILEKHVTHVFGEKRIDSQAAVSIEMMEDIIRCTRASFAATGDKNLCFSEAEKNYGNTGPMKKAMVARDDIMDGEIISIDKIAFRRTEASSPLDQKDLVKLIGSKALYDIKKDEILSFSNVEYQFKQQEFNQFFVSKK